MKDADAPMHHPFQPADAPAIVLASGSATRRRLLESVGLLFEVRAAAVDEESIKLASRAEGVSPAETALVLAELKASRVRVAGALVIGADQILTCEGRWFDKPRDREEAREQLRALRGKSHTLQTAVTCLKNGQVIWHHFEAPELRMRDFSDEFLEIYLDREMPGILGSVGGYLVEGAGAQLFETISGDYSSVLGLPVLALLGFLRQHGAMVR